MVLEMYVSNTVQGRWMGRSGFQETGDQWSSIYIYVCNVVKAIINHPQVITILMGGFWTRTKWGGKNGIVLTTLHLSDSFRDRFVSFVKQAAA